MKMSHVSVSRLQLFGECELKYKYKYHDKLPPPCDEPYHFIYGKFVHEVAEQYCKARYEGADVSPLAIAASLLRECNEDGDKVWPLLPRDNERVVMNVRAIKELDDSIASSFPGARQLFECEFAIPFVRGTFHDGTEAELNAVGFIDRLILHDDGAMLVDYKTTKKSYQKTIAAAASDWQLGLYSMVVAREHGIPIDKITSMLFYLETKKKVPAVFSMGSAASILGEMRSVATSVMAMPPEEAKAKPGRHCGFCDYRTICPAYANTVTPLRTA